MMCCFFVWIRHSTKSMLILIGYSSIGIHDLIDFFVHIYLFNKHTNTQAFSHSTTHSNPMCDRESHKQKYAIQTTNASIIHAATDWLSHAYAQRTHTRPKRFLSVEPVQVWTKLHFGRISVWVQLKPSLSVCSVVRVVRDFKFSMVALFVFMCAYTYTAHIHSFGEPSVCACMRWCSSMQCLRVRACVC